MNPSTSNNQASPTPPVVQPAGTNPGVVTQAPKSAASNPNSTQNALDIAEIRDNGYL